MERNAGDADQPEEDRSEAILYDILDQVFSYLNARDLSYAAKVSKTWRDTARRELAKRGPEAVVLQHAYACEDQFDYSTDDEDEVNRIRYHENRTHVSNFIRSRPALGVFFADDSLVGSRDPWSHIEWHFLDQFSYPLAVIVLEILSVCVNETEAIGTNHLTASLLLPAAQMVNVEIIFVDVLDMKKYSKNKDYAHGVVEKLFPAEENTCIFMFHGPGFEYDADSEAYISKYHSEILFNMKNKRKLKKFGLWGTRVTSLKTKGGDPDHPIPWVGISVSGPSVRSWALILDCNLIDSDIEDKLLAFKKDIHLKAAAVAILLVPSNGKATRAEKLARMTVFKKIFPNVRLLTIFNDREHPVFSLSSTSDETDQEICHMNSISYFIVSYGSF